MVSYRTSILTLIFLVVYFRSLKCTLLHDTAATDDTDEIFEHISEDLTETRLRLVIIVSLISDSLLLVKRWDGVRVIVMVMARVRVRVRVRTCANATQVR